MQFAASYITISLAIYQLFNNFQMNFQFALSLMMLICGLLQLGVYCYFGNHVTINNYHETINSFTEKFIIYYEEIIEASYNN